MKIPHLYKERIAKTNLPISFEYHQLIEHQEMLPEKFPARSQKTIPTCTSDNACSGLNHLLLMYLSHRFAALNQGIPQMVRCLSHFCQLENELACSPVEDTGTKRSQYPASLGLHSGYQLYQIRPVPYFFFFPFLSTVHTQF
ncbi:hypothetical protein OIU79_010806 [Salix purpurea]|uniref:Uncharacterized protein n=1 Tax=Salix purpurea TaxID=77065 RepID=A0A9Q0QGH3_SALPP|nr:hypothetical protein OIU79_010806 [Salix purpurea]